eukprot:SAG31_NODE_1948_length_6834_cov_16.124276_4_plen_38_part_00
MFHRDMSQPKGMLATQNGSQVRVLSSKHVHLFQGLSH